MSVDPDFVPWKNGLAPWTDERRELAKSLWADGISARQIATELGGTNRNAVIGLAHRRGWVRRVVAATCRKPRRRRPIQEPTIPINWTQAKEVQPMTQVVIQPQAPSQPRILWPAAAGGLTIMHLRENTCRYPLWGNDRDEPRFYCGDCPIDASPYCDKHYHRARATSMGG